MKKIVIFLVLILLISGCVQDETVYVTHVIDGDTFETADGEVIRLLGINTPEKGEFYYEEATEYLRELIENRYVKLTGDKTDRDWYERELRYVYLGDVFVNVLMLEGGYARLYLLKDKKYQNVMKYAELDAQASHLGVWRYTN
ncbi:MAG: thermonuclease family protein [Nanoarchaeota archaeon]|nr:thermonuclease family protein [Nanoarchaeota archaeon]